MADDELDTLYWVPPDAFTAERTKLAKAAKQRGDAAAAKRISAARKPTTAAWIVNRLAIGHSRHEHASPSSVTACAPHTPRWTASRSGSYPPDNTPLSANSPGPRSTRPR